MKQQMLDCALAYANFGWSVLPVHYIKDGRCSCGENNGKCTPGKHPLTKRGHLDATMDVNQIKKWWEDFPEANIGIAVGPRSGLSVLDIDPRNGGDKSFSSLVAALGEMPKTVQVRTGGGGSHYYLRYDNLFGIPKEYKAGIDVKNSGYIIAPPSLHASGSNYQWITSQSPEEITLAEVPTWLRVVKVNRDPNLHGIAGNCTESLMKLSGAEELGGETFTFKENTNGTFQIVVNGQVTGCWIDQDGYIGSHSNGGPTIIQWICWYGFSILEANKIARKYKVELPVKRSDGSFNPNRVAATIEKERRLIYCAEDFYEYSNGCYQKRAPEIVRQWIKEILKDLFSRHKAGEVIHSLSTDTFIAVEGLNADRNYINLKNGLFNLTSFQLESHRDSVLSSIQLPVSYDPTAACPLWIKTLDEVFQGNLANIQTFQEFWGYCLVPDTAQEKALLAVGAGSNGKSTTMNAAVSVLGGDKNCSAIPMDCFNNRHYLAGLFGKLANVSIESEAKGELNDANFKAIVSGDSITVDRKFGHPFGFRPFCRLVFAMNNVPRIDDKTDAFYRRLLVLPFNRKFSEEEQDRDLKNKLVAEYDGIFVWMLEGLKRLRIRGRFLINDAMRVEIDAIRKENNNVLLFVEDECVVFDQYKPGVDASVEAIFGKYQDVTNMESKGDLYRAYQNFCKDSGHRSLSKIKFGRELVRNFPQIQGKSLGAARVWENVKLKC